MTVTINDARTVPVQEDLTTDDLRLQVLRGLETMFRADKPLAPATELLTGEWGVLNSDGQVERPGATPVANTYPVFCGTERYDVKATGAVTLILGSHVVLKTNQFDETADYEVGDALTVKDYSAGEAHVTKASSGEPVLGQVLEVGDGWLVFETRRPGDLA